MLRQLTRVRAMSTAAGDALFLGLDSSTQGLKATAISRDFKIQHSFAINYQKDLPHYALVNGVHASAGNVVTQPTLMYLEALDLLFTQMKGKGFPFKQVVSVSGSGQQHGSAYWKKGALASLQGLKGGTPLKTQLGAAFRLPNSPIWMDSSTGEQCAALEKAMGGAARVAEISGSRAYERFTGNQIAKVAGKDAAAYNDVERISLISSLMASVLLGKYAPIDLSDGCGMNLLNLGSREWDEGLLAATAPGLKSRLGDKPVPSHTALGSISPYFTSTYGIPATASVIAWSGDNPCSVAGLGLSTPGDIAVSLGTSDTMFGILPKPSPGLEGHIFVNPMDPASYMAMLCYKNGSLTRERIMKGSGGGTWEGFGALLASTPPANAGAIGFYIDAPEITPAIPKAGVRRFKGGAPVASFTPGEEVRAVVEGQFLSMRIHGESVGITNPKRLIATGGASGNAAILQVLADVFGAPVYIAAQTDSASLGAAVRALHGWEVAKAPGGKFSSVETMRPAGAGGLKHAADPRPAATAAYTALLPAYKAAEKIVCAEKA